MKIYTNEDHLFNAGIIGLCNILKVVPEEDFLQLTSKDLECFSEKYFETLIQRNKEKFKFFSLLKYAEETGDFENIEIKSLNKEIRKLVPFLLNETYLDCYPNELLEKTKQLKPLKKGEESNKQVEILKSLVSFYRSKKNFNLACKIITHKVIDRAIHGISIVSSKKIDNYVNEFDEYFVQPAIKQLESTLTRSTKGHCIMCDSPVQISDPHAISTAFVRGRGFDHRRKTSNVWDFNNDVFICPLCRLIYACIPAAFYYVNQNGIFINNINLANMIKVNAATPQLQSVELALYNNKYVQELVDVQVIIQREFRYETFFLKESILEKWENYQKEFTYLQKKNYLSSNGRRVFLFETIIDNMLRGNNLMPLVEDILYQKLKQKDNFPFNVANAAWILKINSNAFAQKQKEKLFKEVVKEYFEEAMLEETSKYSLKKTLRKPLAFLGEMKIQEINELTIIDLKEKWDLEEEKHINYIKALNPIFKWAKKKKYIKKNPCINFPVSYKRKKRENLSTKYKEKIIEQIKKFDERLYLAILLMRIGLSRSEAACIRWEDIDFEKNTIKISRRVMQIEGGSELKSFSAEKEVSFSEMVKKELEKYKGTGGILKTTKQDFITPNYLNFLYNTFKEKYKAKGMLKDYCKK